MLDNLASLNGDIIRLNTAIPQHRPRGRDEPAGDDPNGCRPNDDVIDELLTLINREVFQGDAVDGHELPMRSSFPFFAQPHMPFPPGAGSEDLARNEPAVSRGR